MIFQIDIKLGARLVYSKIIGCWNDQWSIKTPGILTRS